MKKLEVRLLAILLIGCEVAHHFNAAAMIAITYDLRNHTLAITSMILITHGYLCSCKRLKDPSSSCRCSVGHDKIANISTKNQNDAFLFKTYIKHDIDSSTIVKE
jgi:hypothetical protein